MLAVSLAFHSKGIKKLLNYFARADGLMRREPDNWLARTMCFVGALTLLERRAYICPQFLPATAEGIYIYVRNELH